MLALYAIAGFLVAPPVLLPKIIAAITQQTGCQAEIGNLRVNPFALSITIENFALYDHERRAIVSFRELYVNFETISLFRRAYTFSEIHLVSPRAFIGIRSDGTTNLADIQKFEGPKPDTAKPDTSAAAGMRVIVADLAVDSGKIEFEDLARPAPYRAVFDSLGLALKDFTTIPDETGEYRFEASTGKDERIRWKGNFSVVPLRTSGSFELQNLHGRRLWEYLKDKVNFEFLGGAADFRADYDLDLSRKETRFDLRNGALETRDIALASAIDGARAVLLPRLSVGGIEVRYPKKEITVGKIEAERPSLSNVLSPGGKNVTLRDMFVPKPQPGDTVKKSKPLEWAILLKDIACRNASFRNEDQSTNPPAVISVDSAAIALGNFRIDKPLPADLAFDAVLNGSGRVSSKGTITIDIDNASIDLAQEASLAALPLPSFQPYVAAYAKTEIKSGTLSARGTVRFFQKGAARKMEFRGDVESAGLRMTDTVLHEDFLRYARVEFKKMSFSQFSNSLSIAEIVAHQPYMRFIVGPDRVTNIQNMMVKDSARADSASSKPGAATQKSSAPASPANLAKAPPSMKSRIGAIRILDGSLRFSDLSLTPNFAVGVEEMSGTISKLSSDTLSRADVDLAGKVDKYAPALIKGQINPLTEEAYTDITMSFHGIELTTFSPYSGRFAGYKIEKGKLNVDLHYKLNKSQLDAENKFVLDQLTLGDKVDSPDATSLPVKLAIALLRDSHGVIDLDIPVSGNLNDPDFSVMPIVVKAVVNVFVKAVTAPFKLLGSLFGGGDEDLSYVEFPPASDSLMMRERTKLGSLAKGLTERPSLALEVRGIVVDSIDRPALALRAVLLKIGPVAPAGHNVESWTPSQRKSLVALYRETFKEDPKAALPPSPPGTAEMTNEERDLAGSRAALARLVSSETVSEEAVRSLALRRADAVKSYFVIDSHIGEERVFLTDVNTSAPAKDGLVQMELALQAK